MERLWIAMGGVAGATARAALGQLVGRWAGHAFPWPTLAINILGCLAMGILDGILAARPGSAAWARPLIGIGLLGGFTTFSAFGLETNRLIQRHAPGEAATYVALSLILGIGAVPLGQELARRVAWGLHPPGLSTSGSEAAKAEHPSQ
jgi:CrcB protein